ncbi:MAG TPA: PhzF family phenazine biosynthesis protein [Bacillota bacterium]|jgi:PhzF family phenazine biosynthesis protein|nr:PhzF family phenazine biosynthesis protein [Bacillota bacterium]
MRFYIVDAFTEQVFGGNPAGVVLLPDGAEYPDDSSMRNVAAELRYSETAFIQKKEGGIFRLRYFTPAEEVDLCGHATVATFCALRDEGLASGDYKAETNVGTLNVSLERGFVMMDMASPEAIEVIRDRTALKEIYEVMGLSENEGRVSLEGEWDLYPEIISTGLPDIILPVENREALQRINPDFHALTKLSKKYNVIGVHAFALGEGLIGSNCCEGACDLSQVTAYCRNFGPAVGIDEEAATGTANGGLTYYLYKNALIDAGTGCRFLQGEAMNRPSIVMSSVGPDESDIKIRVGGSGAILAKGEIWF